jgi:galactokinase
MDRFRSEFEQRFERPAEIHADAPGRINLIGEHTDYNHGYVLPSAINRRIHFLARSREDGRVLLWSENFGEGDAFDLEGFQFSQKRPWSNYIRGVVSVLQESGAGLGGFDGWLSGDVPLGAGLSSSAALEVAVLSGLNRLFSLGLEPLQIARLGQLAENRFVGVQCGLMDQFISVFGQPGSAVFLDCVSLEHRTLPFDLADHGLALLVYDTRVKRELAGSEYNRRREEAAEALKVLAGAGVESFREATMEALTEHRGEMPDAVFRRARHVINENARVLGAVEDLVGGDFVSLGERLFLSHESLRDDYQVSCPELDLLYERGRLFPGCLGARMTGAGFGGSGIAVLEADRAATFKAEVMEESARRGYRTPVFHDVCVDGGAAAERLD